MFVVGKCKKCKQLGLINAGDYPKEKIDKFMMERDFGECAFGGWHVELGKMGDYIDLDWDKTFETKEEADKYLEGAQHV